MFAIDIAFLINLLRILSVSLSQGLPFKMYSGYVIARVSQVETQQKITTPTPSSTTTWPSAMGPNRS